MGAKENKSLDRVARLDVNGYDGTLLERWKAKTTQKGLGVKMVERILVNFNLTLSDVEEKQKEELNEELRLQKELFKQP